MLLAKFTFNLKIFVEIHFVTNMTREHTTVQAFNFMREMCAVALVLGVCLVLANRMLSVNWIYHKNHAKSQFSASFFSIQLSVSLSPSWIVRLLVFWWEFICWRHSNDKREMIQIVDSAKTADNCAKNAIKWQRRVKTMNDLLATFASISAIS